MLETQPINLATAAQLLDFAGPASHIVSASAAAGQLEGAVALHNLLGQSGNLVAYLADEVGMGKTYVVLGTIGLLRHYHPGLRVLYIVPKRNLQDKWRKEIRNFAANNWRVTDHRVKSFQGRPVVEPVVCDNLLDWAREVTLDANRDFILRLSSFSLPLSSKDGGAGWKQKAKEMRAAFPGLAEWALEIDGRTGEAQEERKDAFARALNELLPHFDLLVLDEGHNLKHGFQGRDGAARNRLLAYALGTKPVPGRQRLERRIDRAILLSATPVDNGYKDLWNQLDLLGLGDERYAVLGDKESDEVAQKAAAAKCLIRRLTQITIGGQPHTRNMYRREWRGGGVREYDQPLKVPGDQQRLIVALMQKMLADLLDEQARTDKRESEENRGRRTRRAAAAQDRQRRFQRRFQIGMLASFESFGITAKLRNEESSFDQSEQSEDPQERDGIDRSSVNAIARSYRKEFEHSLPHPKMNEVVDDLWQAFLQGRKTLVFVRRVLSVPEIVEKLTQKYDDWLGKRILEELQELPEPERQRLQTQYERYKREVRNTFYSKDATTAFAGGNEPVDDDFETTTKAKDGDSGGSESFYSWFFRGKGPPGIVSGAALVRNRLGKESSQLAVLFEDNWLLWLLDYPDDPLAELSRRLGIPIEGLADQLGRRAAAIHGTGKPKRLQIFLAYQRAALELLHDAGEQTAGPMPSKLAEVILDTLGWTDRQQLQHDDRSFPDARRYLGLKTFFTELAQRDELCRYLWPVWRAAESGDTPQECERRVIEREQRRLLLSSAIRLGHSIIDLWLLHTRLTGTLAPGRDDETDSSSLESSEEDQPVDSDAPITERLSRAFLDRLDRQRQVLECSTGPTSFMELHRIANDFPLLVNVNFHDMRDQPLVDLPRYFANKLGQQQPFAGMYGGYSKVTVGQFRMPGYPYVLVTTDVLQEGEDLHTYCDRIVHYGFSWTPSATEQRIGRVDRIGSLVQRRLETAPSQTIGERDYLQVYFPYLRDTYEFVQVGRVFERLNRFLELLHDLRPPRHDQQASHVHVTPETCQPRSEVFQQYLEELKSGFPIPETLIARDGPAESVAAPENNALLGRFDELVECLLSSVFFEQDSARWAGHERKGKVFVNGGRLLRRGEDRHENTVREQVFLLTLRGTHGGQLLLRCESPLGTVKREDFDKALRLQRDMPHLKVCLKGVDETLGYHLVVRSDLLFSPKTTQFEELEYAFTTIVTGADEMESKLFDGADHREDQLIWNT
ncbi:MAG: DEAD/DEAH box helicase family protein [Pirellulaceae bacterium]|nr:DEAD/DEAH box helicase family protein [Pirellulaceae bacterium]